MPPPYQANGTMISRLQTRIRPGRRTIRSAMNSHNADRGNFGFRRAAFGLLRPRSDLAAERPEHKFSQASQHGRRERKAADQRHEQADSDGGSTVAEFAEVGKEHHAEADDRGQRAGHQRFADPRERFGNRHFRG